VRFKNEYTFRLIELFLCCFPLQRNCEKVKKSVKIFVSFDWFHVMKIILFNGCERRYSMELYASGIIRTIAENDKSSTVEIDHFELHRLIPNNMQNIRICFLIFKYLIIPFLFLWRVKRYDIVHIVDQSYGFLIFLKHILPRVKFICTVHDLIPFYGYVNSNRSISLPYRFSIWATKFANVIIFPSEFTAGQYNKIKPATNVRQMVCRHGLQIPLSTNLWKRNKFPELGCKLNVGFALGEFYKRTDFSLAICNELSQKYELCLHILGTSDQNLIENLAPSNVTSITFHTGLSSAKMISFYTQIDLFLFPSEIEGLGQPLIEALNVGCPVFASDIPIFREVVNSSYNLFRCESSREIWSFLKNYHSQEQNRELIYALDRYRWDKFYSQYCVLLDRRG
jgi:glycosyltransferase involved in cell wall biosynthesis